MFCCPKILRERWEDTNSIEHEEDFYGFNFPDVSSKRTNEFILALKEYIERMPAAGSDKEICAKYLKAYQIISGKIPFSPIESDSLINDRIETYAIWYDKVDLMKQLTWSTNVNRFRFPDIPYTGPIPPEPARTNYPGGVVRVNADIQYFPVKILEYYLTLQLFKDFLETGNYSSIGGTFSLAPNVESAKLVIEKYKAAMKDILAAREKQKQRRKLGKIMMKPPTFLFEEARKWYETIREEIEEEHQEMMKM